MKLFFKTTLMAVALAGTSHAMAAGDDIFLKLSGIAGDSVDERHRGEIVLKSYTQTVSNSSVGLSGGGAGTGKATCGEVTVSKNLDISSPALIMGVLTGTTVRDGVITFRKPTRELFEYYTVQLVGITLSAVEQADVAGGGVTEVVKLKARQFTYTVRPQRADGSLGAPLSFGFDCVSGSRF